MRPTIRRFCSRLGRCLVQAGVVLALAAFVVLAIGPRTGRYQVATVLSASMRPTMPEGSMALITPMAARDVRVGDVVTYQIPVEDRRVVTHRVVQIVEDGDQPVIRSQGDANDTPDPWTARLAAGPLWKVRAALPGLGYGVNALRAPAAQRLCVLVLPLVMCVIWLGEIWLPRRDRPQPVTAPALLPADPPACVGTH